MSGELGGVGKDAAPLVIVAVSLLLWLLELLLLLPGIDVDVVVMVTVVAVALVLDDADVDDATMDECVWVDVDVATLLLVSRPDGFAVPFTTSLSLLS